MLEFEIGSLVGLKPPIDAGLDVGSIVGSSSRNELVDRYELLCMFCWKVKLDDGCISPSSISPTLVWNWPQDKLYVYILAC